MEYIVLDTDVASQIIKERLTGPLVGRLAGPVWAVTFVTVGELWKWAELRSWGVQSRSWLETWLSRVVILLYNTKVSRTWGEIAAAAQRRSGVAGPCRSTTRGSRRAAWRASCRWRR